MARPWTVAVTDWPRLAEHRVYKVLVKKVIKHTKPEGALVTIEHLDHAQRGRRHQFVAPFPIHPAGFAASFFQACGQVVDVDARVAPKDCVDRTLLARFRCVAGGEYEPISFGPVIKENNDDREPAS